ncbi:LOW QUALITY PROTEIN: platelet glycoprotein VI [Saccopteryx leptura]|uniref:LOW QUALITY PROTEIN: platelet glycoprotein VI n=1 Tax=Saccopteryx leptura TaxID=249018 RepID=UPI00339BAE17
MSPTLSALFCLGLRLGQVIYAQMDPLPKPSLQALPSPLVPLNKPVTLRCQGPPGVDLYRLEKLKPRNHEDEAVLFIPAMKKSSAGQYRCLYQNGSRWSPPSKLLELVATGFYPKPSLHSAQPSPAAVSPGGDVTLQCQSRPGFDQYVLYTDGDSGPHKGPERWYRADFPIITVTAAHSGTYKCYSFKRSSPYLWSAPSDPLELVVTGTSVTARQLSAEAPFSVTGMSHTTKSIKPTEMARRTTTTTTTTLTTTNVGAEEISEPSRNITIFPGGPGSPTGLTGQYYTVGNLVRICLGIVILIFLVGLLAEDWHSWKKSPLRWVRAVHRPLPPLPQTQKTQLSGSESTRWS